MVSLQTLFNTGFEKAEGRDLLSPKMTEKVEPEVVSHCRAALYLCIRENLSK